MDSTPFNPFHRALRDQRFRIPRVTIEDGWKNGIKDYGNK